MWSRTPAMVAVQGIPPTQQRLRGTTRSGVRREQHEVNWQVVWNGGSKGDRQLCAHFDSGQGNLASRLPVAIPIALAIARSQGYRRDAVIDMIESLPWRAAAARLVW